MKENYEVFWLLFDNSGNSLSVGSTTVGATSAEDALQKFKPPVSGIVKAVSVDLNGREVWEGVRWY